MASGEMNYKIRDIYPNWTGLETSTAVAPESDDQKALNEDSKVADTKELTAGSDKTDFKAIMIALAVMVAIIVFFGGAK